ncbi:MAG: efflux RND transporter periplasmic adaptor subunit [Pseudomonadales bacterium]|nr:efflux RND transporter periplasmic adaptor subunit [Pseudomonadales bacterium]
MNLRTSPLLLSFIAAAGLTLSACDKKTAVVETQTEVVVAQVSETEHTATIEFVGRLQAKEDIKIQAKVSGYLLEHPFKEGDNIHKGDKLFIIDPAPFAADLAGAQAKISQATANVDITTTNYKRAKRLIKTNAISQLDLDNLRADKLEADAGLKSAEASLKNAQLNLQYTTLVAPIDGRIGEKKYSLGDLVGPDAGALTTLVSIDPIQAVFQVNETLFYNVGQEQRQRVSEGKNKLEFTVKIRLSSGDIYPLEGKLDFVSNRVNTDTGTLTIRAEIPNPDGLLRPGQYVKVLVESLTPEKSVSVPAAAILSDQQGDFVFTVDETNTVHKHKVDLTGDSKGLQFIRSDQVKPGDQVIIAGIKKVRDGQTVKARSRDKPKSDTETAAKASTQAQAEK